MAVLQSAEKIVFFLEISAVFSPFFELYQAIRWIKALDTETCFNALLILRKLVSFTSEN